MADQRLYELYDNAVGSDGETSLGSGATLYRAVEKKLRDELGHGRPQPSLRTARPAVQPLPRPRTRRRLPAWLDDLRAFAFKQLPERAQAQTNNYTSIVNNVANTLARPGRACATAWRF